MLHSIRDLMHFTAKAGEATFPIKNAFFSLQRARLSFLVIDTGSWFNSDMVLIASHLIKDVALHDASVALDTSEQAIKSAPVWNEGSGSLLEMMPPIVVGPFGNTFSPLMLAASATEVEETRLSGEPLLKTLSDFESFRGTDVFGSDGELGRINDILFDKDSHALTHLVIDNLRMEIGRERIVPIEKLRYEAEQETHIVLDLTSTEINDAPRLQRTDTLEPERIEALRNYYKLPIL